MAGTKQAERERMPRWLHRPVLCGAALRRVEEVLESERLNTVCVGAGCPNRGECFSSGTATFMIMGDTCTRDCRFCAVSTGEPQPLDEGEPEAVARAASSLGLGHVVVTSVTRDDLPNGGAGHFSRTVGAVRRAVPQATVEVLVPDFKGSSGAVDRVLDSGPDVFSHNMETVKRLYPPVRPRAGYRRSLSVLRRSAQAGMVTKSGFMVGLGESRPEVDGLLSDLLDAGCGLVTVGQYLRPGGANLPVERYLEPEEFGTMEEKMRSMGFEAVYAGPFVRSSYNAAELFEAARGGRAAARR